ncbi:hypothetical protein ACQR1I_09735 [Bradyrhizobium sp. HKCCYLS2038]|uniref:hypothetical protein n=1 Tax=unclassified Bradyrhizobium TaxID=2631580 RepID=UPI003EBE53FD
MDLGSLPGALSARGINWEWAKENSSGIPNAHAAIRRAQVFIGVLNGTNSDYRVVYEVGVAAGLEKSILLITSPRRKLPFDLRPFSVARLKLTDHRALNFHLDAFLAAPARSVFEEHARILRGASQSLIVPDSGRRMTDTFHSGLEKEVFELIIQAGGTAIAQPQAEQSEGYRPDLLVWLGSYDPELLDPAVIEVKGRVDPKDVRSIEERLLNFMNVSGVRTGLVITSEAFLRRSQPIWPNLFWLDLSTFSALLRSSQLGSHLREMRNRAIHGVR